jgi:hypothetical protein
LHAGKEYRDIHGSKLLAGKQLETSMSRYSFATWRFLAMNVAILLHGERIAT